MFKAVRPVRVLLAALAVALIAVLAGPASMSWAHAELISSTPKDGAALSAPPASVVLTFSDPIAAEFVKVAVTTPAGPGKVAASTKGPVVTVPVPAGGPGAYKIVYRVVSADGHPVSGTVQFTVSGAPTAGTSASGSPASTGGAATSGAAASGTATPSSTSGRSFAAAPTGAPDQGGPGGLVYGAIGLAVAAGLGGLWLAVRGRRT